MMKLTSWFEEKQQTTDTIFADLLCNIAPEMCGNRLLHCTDVNVEIIMLNELINSSAVQGFEAWAKQSKRLRKRSDTLSSCHILDIVQRQMEFLLGALESLMRAADIRPNFTALNRLKKAADKTSNPRGDHKDTAESYYWLGIVQREMSDFSGALDSLQKSARLRKELFGDNLQTADSYHSLGEVQCDIGDPKRALESFQRAADIRYNLLGGHEDTAGSYHNLGQVQSEMGDHKSASASLQKAANIRYNLLGSHTDTACSYHSLGKVQCDMGD